jgi:hypothetical protein
MYFRFDSWKTDTNPPRVVVVTRDASPAEVGQAVEKALEAGE